MDFKGHWPTLESLPPHYNWGIRMWTDGSCWPNHGPGGWATKIELRHDTGYGSYVTFMTLRAWGHQKHLCTTPQAEMNAILTGLQTIPPQIVASQIELIADSEWAIRILTGEYRRKMYFEEWAAIEALFARFPKKIYTHVPGHYELTCMEDPEFAKMIKGNHECDNIAHWARVNDDISDVAFRLEESHHGFSKATKSKKRRTNF